MATSKPTDRPEPGQILIVIHDFKARSSDELSLSRGDRVELVERDDDFGDGWYLGRHLMNGNSGLFPEVYTKPAPRGTPIIPNAPIPRSDPSPLPLAGVANPTTAPVPSSTINTAQLPNQNIIEPEKSEKQAHRESQNSSATNEVEQASQTSRRISSSGIPDSEEPTSPLTTPAPPEDIATLAALSPSSTSSAPRNPALSSVANSHISGQESPVMNETLSVIQEHISDMSIPRHNISRERHVTNDSGSEYSSNVEHRLSYINGEETDEEVDNLLNETEVNSWDPDKVADYLSSVGVEKRHCDVFREQEITGDVLLGMEQTSVFLKEFDLGSVGRRLKTWQKIKVLQDEVKGGTPSGTRRSTQMYGSEFGSEESVRNRSQSHTGVTLPRIAGVNERPGSRQTTRYSQQQVMRSSTMPIPSPISPNTVPEESNTADDQPARPSAASIRDLHHSRRHSSIDFNGNMMTSKSTMGTESPTASAATTSHKKGPSFDKNWSMGSQSPSIQVRPVSTGKADLLSDEDEERLAGVNVATPWEFDRGYFSGGDIEDRPRNLLRKKNTPSHSRTSSYTDEQRARSATTNARHSRFGSMDSARDSHVSTASQKYYGLSARRRTPSTSSASPQPIALEETGSPTVTKLDGSAIVKSPNDSLRSPEKSKIPNWLQPGNGIASPRGLGLRAMPDAVTGPEKSHPASPMDQLSSPLKDESLQSPSRTESSTSGGPSFELDSPNSSKAPSTMTTPGSRASRKKSKKETSAYTRGLEKKTPQEQMMGCDYSGWMKKKSTNLMTTWKPRLFILKGRRLSYYYSENDDQEQGLIDISFHRVLPADTDRLTGLHATLTGATTSPTTPTNSHTETAADKDAAAEPQSSLSKGQGDQMFIFKLVPPRAGLSRAVTFTKPTVHYFAVPNLAQGRLWMAALMKATIDRDDTKPITTTYQQKTISLMKARAMRHRPPALMNLDEKVEDEPVKTPGPDLSGLNIRGIIFDKETGDGDSGISKTSKKEKPAKHKTSSSQSSLTMVSSTQMKVW